MLIHGDPAVIDTVFEIAPKQTVIWAHAGAFPHPDLVSDYLRRSLELSIDVSMRDECIAPDGVINNDWYELFMTYPDRVLIGVDTYSTARWHLFTSAVGTVGNWLNQLPDEVAIQLAYLNAVRLYKKLVITKSEEGVKGGTGQ